MLSVQQENKILEYNMDGDGVTDCLSESFSEIKQLIYLLIVSLILTTVRPTGFAAFFPHYFSLKISSFYHHHRR